MTNEAREGKLGPPNFDSAHPLGPDRGTLAERVRLIDEKQKADKAEWEANVLVRRTKASCGVQLPPKQYSNYELE